MSDHKQVKIKKESSPNGITMGSDGNRYPYGTSLNFDNDMIDDLEISQLSVGDVVEIRGYAYVDSKSERSNKESSTKDIRLQMTSIKIEREEDDTIIKLYGE